ncbi:MAG: glycosyltransferase [Clostridia bacterium]|nr:glycosyltransferase [Clostridia bacterium]
MKIVIVLDFIDVLTNGTVMTARRLADGLRTKGHTVKIAAIGAEGTEDFCAMERYVPLLTDVSARNQFKFAKFDEDKMRAVFQGADIIHFICPFKFEKRGKKLADKMGIPTTAAFHVQPENISYNAHIQWIKPFNSFVYFYFRHGFYKHFDRIHCPSAFIADQLKKHKYKAKTYVISNGYDPVFALPENFTHNELFEIVMVGRLSNEKNQKMLVKGISESKYRDKIHLTLYGHGPMKDKLKKQADKLNVSLTFGFLPKDQLSEALGKADLYVHSASVEIEAIACIEATACGLVPVIARSNLSATKQFALDERSLYNYKDSRELAEKIDYWFENPGELQRMRYVYAECAKKYSLENSINMMEEMFKEQIADYKR